MKYNFNDGSGMNIPPTALSFFARARYTIVFILLLGSSFANAQTFVNTMVPQYNFLFPYPYRSNPLPSTLAPTSPPLDFFYNNNFGGACYNQTANFSGVDCNIYLKGMNHQNVSGFGGAYISYNATPITDPVDHNFNGSGVTWVDADVTEMQVGMYKTNTQLFVVAAYYKVGAGFYLDTWELTASAGLVKLPGAAGHLLLDAYVVFPRSRTDAPPRISMDCSDLNDVVVAWDHPLVGVFVKGFSVVGGVMTASPNYLTPSGGGFRMIMPDVAMSKWTPSPGASSTPNIHLVGVATAPVYTIYKYSINFNNLMLGSASAVLEDAEPVSGFYTGVWDEFQLKIDAPDHFTNLLPGTYDSDKWAYAYYHNDNSKIKVRMCPQGLPFSATTYVVNDGSLNGPGGISMGNAIGSPASGDAGAAFPAICFAPEGYNVYVGWYTTYDPTATTQTPLYQYNPDSKRYLGILLNVTGVSVFPDYNVIQDGYSNNEIGGAIPKGYGSSFGYPKLCFSKHDGSNKMYSVFATHDMAAKFNMNVFVGASIYNYFESFDFGGTTGNPYKMFCGGWGSVAPGYYISGLGYTGVSAGTPSPAIYMDQKATNWWSAISSPNELFRKAELSAAVDKASDLMVGPNPFTHSIQLSGSDKTMQLEAALSDIAGKVLLKAKGNIGQINMELSKESSTLLTGVYLLHCKEIPSGKTQVFKINKQ
jgi:hypothetical protein